MVKDKPKDNSCTKTGFEGTIHEGLLRMVLQAFHHKCELSVGPTSYLEIPTAHVTLNLTKNTEGNR